MEKEWERWRRLGMEEYRVVGAEMMHDTFRLSTSCWLGAGWDGGWVEQLCKFENIFQIHFYYRIYYSRRWMPRYFDVAVQWLHFFVERGASSLYFPYMLTVGN